MPNNQGGKSTKDILDILREAREQNDADISASSSARKPELEATKIVGSEGGAKKRTKVTKRINAETAELIDQYSTRKDEKKLSDTQQLRKKLAEQNENSELLGYLSEENNSGKSKRVEKLYEMINDAKTRTLSDLEKKPPVSIKSPRFSDEATVETQTAYTQEQMFPLGDTFHFDQEKDEHEVASFDADYEKLTEKVTNGEIDFAGEAENEGQVKFVSDDEKLQLLVGEDLDETDINLRLAFEMMDDDEGKLDQLVERNRQNSRRDREERENEVSVKYTSREQNAEMASKYRKCVRKSFLRVIIVALLSLGILFLELATNDSELHSDFFRQGIYGILYKGGNEILYRRNLC